MYAEQNLNDELARRKSRAIFKAAYRVRRPLGDECCESALQVVETRSLHSSRPKWPDYGNQHREVTVLLRLEQPMLAVLGGVLSEDECQQLIDLARPRLARSGGSRSS